MLPRLLLTVTLLSLGFSCFCQHSMDSSDKLTTFPVRFLDKINNKAISLGERLTKKTDRHLKRLLKNEAKLKRKMMKMDSTAAKQLFSYNAGERYASLAQELKTATPASAVPSEGRYMPYIDSLQNCLSFLDANPELISSSNLLPADIHQPLQQLQQFQSKLRKAELIQQFIHQRKDQIRRYLAKYTALPAGISRVYKDYSKQMYYYTEQVAAYKEMLNNPDKLFKTALNLVNKLPAFTEFMKKNSVLAGIFGMPGSMTGGGGGGSSQILTGLQTRSQIISFIQNQPGGATNTIAALNRSVQDAQGQLDDLRSKLDLKGLQSDDLDMPKFKPNHQKTKSFWQRLEYGTNLQTVRASSFFPATSDLGLSVGFKLNDRSVIGIGGSYKLGWGENIRRIRFSGEGLGLRTYVDLQLRKSFYLSGGFEYNYQEPFDGLVPPAGTETNDWQQSGLIGLSKIVSLKTKFFKKTKLQLLWDFMSYQQSPQTTALKFRVGYIF